MQAFELYNLVPFAPGNIGWAELARQLPTVLVLCVVCSLGTSMDVMAVQARCSLPMPLPSCMSVPGS